MGITPSATKQSILAAYLPANTTVNAHLVTAAVVDANTTVAAITPVAGGNYALQALTSSAPTVSGTAALVTTTASPVWTNMYAGTNAAVVGVAFSKQLTGAPLSTDPIIGYAALSAQTTVAACTTTANSEVVSTTNSFTTAGFVRGQLITGSNIPLGTTIAEVVSATQLILSQPATSSLAGSLTVTAYTPSSYVPPTTANTSTLTVPLPPTGLLTFV